MANKLFKGFKQVTQTSFNSITPEEGIIYFVRTGTVDDSGYIYFNGKKYGEDETVIDCGDY